MNRRGSRSRCAVLLASVSLVACDDSGAAGGVDASPPAIDASAVSVDASRVEVDATVDAPARSCTAGDYGDAGALDSIAVSDGGIVQLYAPLTSRNPIDAMLIALVPGRGVFANGTLRTGTFELTEVEAQPTTCGLCVVVWGDASTVGGGDPYLATSGTVTITSIGDAIGDRLAGSLDDVELRHVTVENDATTTPAEDGCTAHIASATFDTVVIEP